MKVLAPSTPRVRTPKVLSGVCALWVTVETLTSCAKVKYVNVLWGRNGSD